MTKTLKLSELTEFDPSKYLDDTALRPEAHPRFDTIQRVCKALGVRQTATPA